MGSSEEHRFRSGGRGAPLAWPRIGPGKRDVDLLRVRSLHRCRRSQNCRSSASDIKCKLLQHCHAVAELVMEHGADLVALAWAAQLGTLPLAAASLASATYAMVGRLVVSGICGALDTKAAQVLHFSSLTVRRLRVSSNYAQRVAAAHR